MKVTKIHREVLKLVLKSIFHGLEGGLKHSFMFEPSECGKFKLRGGSEFYVDSLKFDLAALYLKQHGPDYLKSNSLGEIRRKISKFIKTNFAIIAREIWFDRSDESFFIQLSKPTFNILCLKLATSKIFEPESVVFHFPTNMVSVEGNIFFNNFYFKTPTNDGLENFYEHPILEHLDFSSYPFLKGSEYRKTPVTGWLSVRSPDEPSAKKTIKLLCAALSLTMRHWHRYLLSGASSVQGCGWITDRYHISSGGVPIIPPLMKPIPIKSQQIWMNILDSLLSSKTKQDRRKKIALEYFYNAWTLKGPQRLPLLFMSIEALTGNPSNATQSFIEGVRNICRLDIEYDRLKLLVSLRGSVMHGGAPDVHESSKYPKYIRNYAADPIDDLEALAQECLKKSIFNDEIILQPDPDADIIKTMKERDKYFREPNIAKILLAPTLGD